ncbi:MAG: hypothetical protein NVSMB12_22200 [Acidimicrobiales bacterium]
MLRGGSDRATGLLYRLLISMGVSCQVIAPLSVAPDGFTVADLAAKVHAVTGNDYTVRQAGYDIKKSAPSNSSSNPPTPAATTSHLKPPAP